MGNYLYQPGSFHLSLQLITIVWNYTHRSATILVHLKVIHMCLLVQVYIHQFTSVQLSIYISLVYTHLKRQFETIYNHPQQSATIYLCRLLSSARPTIWKYIVEAIDLKGLKLIFSTFGNLGFLKDAHKPHLLSTFQ